MVRLPVWSSIGVMLAVAVSTPAQAHEAVTGGASAPDRPRIEALRCDTGETRRCSEGDILRLDGEHLQTARVVTFVGGRGREDDRRSAPELATAHRVTVRVPTTARTGPVRVSSSVAGTSARSPKLQVLPSSEPVPELLAAEAVFPVQGRHDFGTATNRFGGGRNHGGHDILAGCGLKVVAAKAGVVSRAEYEAGAGNYVVIDAEDGTSQVYMHMRDRALVRRADRVAAGDQLGWVGTTGRSTACHLHFELWTAPGWGRGGGGIDPLPELERWAAAA